MALPQTIDQSTLNLSGKPSIATAPTTTTSSGASNIQNPRIENVKNEVSPLLGGLFGGLLGYAAQNRGAGATQQTSQQGTNQQQTGVAKPDVSGIAKSILNAVKGTTGTSSGTSIGGGSTGTVNGMAFPPGTTQQDIDLQLGTTNGQSNYIIAGTNMSNGTIIAQPNYDMSGYLSTGTGAGPSDTATPPSDQTPGTYFQDSYGNIYDPSGNLYAVYDAGAYYVNTGTDQWTNVDTGDSWTTNEVFGNTGGGYDSNAGMTDITGGGSYADNSIFDTSPIDTGTYVKDGGFITGLPTPLFRRGGNVKHFATGGNSIIDAATAMAPSTALDASTPVATSAADTSTTPAVTNTSAGSIADLVTNLLSNKALTGAGLGALLTQLINSGTTHPTNMGVDMSALATLKPRTTPTGAAKFVPYSEYGTPTTPYDYSSLYQNLGVSPFGSGAVSPSTPTSAAPTPTTTPTTGGLSTVTPSTTTPTTTTPTAPSTPMYYSDADGNIYDANGDLVYDTTSSSVVTPTTSSTASSSLAVPSVATTPTVTSPSYSYGTPVNPSDVLSSKKGGLAKLALGGQPITDNLNVPVSNKPFSNVPAIQGRGDYRTGAYVEGAGDGQSDDIPAMLADGEYVIDAETVAQLGNGSNKAGAKILDQFRQNIRAHKRSAPHDKIPPKSKSALAYLKGAK